MESGRPTLSTVLRGQVDQYKKAQLLDQYLRELLESHDEATDFFEYFPELLVDMFGFGASGMRGWLDGSQRDAAYYEVLLSLLHPHFGSLVKFVLAHRNQEKLFYLFPVSCLPEPTQSKFNEGDYASLPPLYRNKVRPYDSSPIKAIALNMFEYFLFCFVYFGTCDGVQSRFQRGIDSTASEWATASKSSAVIQPGVAPSSFTASTAFLPTASSASQRTPGSGAPGTPQVGSPSMSGGRGGTGGGGMLAFGGLGSKVRNNTGARLDEQTPSAPGKSDGGSNARRGAGGDGGGSGSGSGMREGIGGSRGGGGGVGGGGSGGSGKWPKSIMTPLLNRSKSMYQTLVRLYVQAFFEERNGAGSGSVGSLVGPSHFTSARDSAASPLSGRARTYLGASTRLKSTIDEAESASAAAAVALEASRRRTSLAAEVGALFLQALLEFWTNQNTPSLLHLSQTHPSQPTHPAFKSYVAPTTRTLTALAEVASYLLEQSAWSLASKIAAPSTGSALHTPLLSPQYSSRNLHAHSTSPGIGGAPLSCEAALSLLQQPLYVLLRLSLTQYQLDSSTPLSMLLHLWLVLLQPWDCAPASAPTARTIASWRFYIERNFLLYALVLRDVVHLASGFNFNSIDSVSEVQKVVSVFNKSELLEILRECERALLHSLHSSNTFLTPARGVKGSNALEDLAQAMVMQWIALEGKQSNVLDYFPLFCTTEDAALESKQEKSLLDLHHAQPSHRTKDAIVQLAKNIQSSSESLKQPRMMNEQSIGNPAAVMKLFSSFWENDTKSHKTDQLHDLLIDLQSVFQVELPEETRGESRCYSSGEKSVLFADEDAKKKLSALGKEQIMRGIRKCSNLDAEYTGPEELRPITSNESAAIARLMYRVSRYLTTRVLPPGQQLPFDLRLLASYHVQAYIVLGLLIFYLFLSLA